MDEKSISIITISFNSEKTIEHTIKSILSQNTRRLEYIIKDGGSTDDTINIANSFNDSRMNVMVIPDNGISDAFNQGILASHGDIIGLINSDDILLPNAVSKILDIFDNNEKVDVVYGNCARFTSAIGDGYTYKPPTDLSSLKYKFLLYHPAVFIRKESYEKYGLYDCSYKNAMDYELISRMYFNGAKFLYVDECFSAFREGGVSESAFSRTMNEHKKIAMRNGANYMLAESYIVKLYIRRKVIKILNGLGIEKKLRKVIKGQENTISE